jgi:uncharacterized membrane protein (DUF4010 family)
VLVIGSALAPDLLVPLASGLVPAIVGFLALGLLWVSRPGPSTDLPGASTSVPEITLKNPFEIQTVLSFALLLGLISLLSKVAITYLGASALFAVAAISGLVDVDAITLSTARLTGTAINLTTAAGVILLAVAVNMVTKVALGLTAGSRGYGLALAQASAISVALGAVGYLSYLAFLPG